MPSWCAACASPPSPLPSGFALGWGFQGGLASASAPPPLPPSYNITTLASGQGTTHLGQSRAWWPNLSLTWALGRLVAPQAHTQCLTPALASGLTPLPRSPRLALGCSLRPAAHRHQPPYPVIAALPRAPAPTGTACPRSGREMLATAAPAMPPPQPPPTPPPTPGAAISSLGHNCAASTSFPVP